MTQAQLPAKKSQAATIRDLLARQKDQIKAALPQHITPDKMLRVAMTSIQSNPVLLQCDQMSLIRSVMEASQLGLVLDGILGYAYLVPYKVKGTYKAQLQIGYRGYIDLAYRSGRISALYAQIVRSNDEYEYEEGLERKLIHKPNSKLGDLIAAYAVVKYKDGATDFEWMWKAEIDAIRNQSKASQSGPWATHYTEMARKTPIRKLAKRLPLSTDKEEPLLRAALTDEYGDSGVLDAEVLEEKTQQRVAEMKEEFKEDETPKEDVICPVCKFEAKTPTSLKKHITYQANQGDKAHIHYLNPPKETPPDETPDKEPPPDETPQKEETQTNGEQDKPDLEKKRLMVEVSKFNLDIRKEAFARLEIAMPETLSELDTETIQNLIYACEFVQREVESKEQW